MILERDSRLATLLKSLDSAQDTSFLDTINALIGVTQASASSPILFLCLCFCFVSIFLDRR